MRLIILSHSKKRKINLCEPNLSNLNKIKVYTLHKFPFNSARINDKFLYQNIT